MFPGPHGGQLIPVGWHFLLGQCRFGFHVVGGRGSKAGKEEPSLSHLILLIIAIVLVMDIYLVIFIVVGGFF